MCVCVHVVTSVPVSMYEVTHTSGNGVVYCGLIQLSLCVLHALKLRQVQVHCAVLCCAVLHVHFGIATSFLAGRS